MSTYIIIGGSSGIGLALAKTLENQSHNVIATYNKNRPSGAMGITYHHYDVMDENSEIDFIPDTVDGIIYCPGSINLKPFGRIKKEDFRSDFDLQVGGAITFIQKALPALKRSAHSSILLFSTVAVQQGFNFHTQVSVSKGAIEGLTKSLAAELAPKVRVNCIAPSLVDTPLAARLLSTNEKKEANAARNPMKKIGQPEDIAEIAAFLLSNKANWITGQIINVDGGMSTLKL